ncbi:MAG TPA: hypothetical protein VMY18_01950 [Acidobacteriota bacterium]|nr:hypothetical protein [Acidobacteriota bacterium]
MPRSTRHKSSEPAFYHLFNRVAGDPKYFPFRKRAVARKFLSLFERYLELYFCSLASFELMWNHFHSVVFFEAYRELHRHELHHRARLRFGRLWRLKTRHWDESHWEQFNRDLFDVSCFMQHVNGEFAKWFNHRYHRRGPFWADRFKNPELLDPDAVQNAILYTELNAVRAGLVKRPEDYRMGSAYWRLAHKKTDLLIPLEELFPAERGEDAFTTYRALLYYRGAVATKDNQAVIPDSIVRQEEARGFARPGVFCRRLPFFTQGVAIGGRQEVSRLLEEYREKGLYTRRRNPIPQLAGRLFSLREQRSHAFSPG